MTDNQTTKNKDWLNSFIERNAWAILVSLVGMTMLYTTLSGKVQALESHVSSLQSLVEKVIVLEQRENNIEADIFEIKEDIKEIKNSVK